MTTPSFDTDQFLKQLYVKLKKMQDFRGLVYFSDHGEDSRKGIGHNATQYEPIMTHIPLLSIFHRKAEKRGLFYGRFFNPIRTAGGPMTFSIILW